MNYDTIDIALTKDISLNIAYTTPQIIALETYELYRQSGDVISLTVNHKEYVI